MIKKLFPFLSVIMLALFVGACSSEDVMPDIDQGASSRTVTFEALMPGSGATTRVTAEEQADRSIDLKWENDDQIVLLFEQGAVKKSTTAKIVTADGETGTFRVTLPEGIVGTADYKLYGVYGSAGAPTGDNTVVDLPSAGDLGKKILLHFTKEVKNNAIGSVEFAHKGYVFTAKVEVASGTVANISLSADEGWAISSSNYKFDIVSGEFTTSATAAKTIALENFAVKDGVATARSWFPAIDEEALPALKLSVNDGDAVTAEAKKAKTPVAGDAYYLYAKYDGTELVFADKEFETGTKISIADLRAKYVADGTYAEDHFIEGEVVLNAENDNVNALAAYVADETAGISFFFTFEDDVVTDAPLGAKVRINLEGATWDSYNGLIQLKSLSTSTAVEILEPTATTPLEPRVVTIQELLDGNYQSELVQVNNVQFKNVPATYGSNPNLIDNNAIEINVRSSSGATFKDENVPEGNGPFIGVVGMYNNAQLHVRETADLAGMTGPRYVPPFINVNPFSLTFEKEAGSETIAVTANVAWTATSDAAWATISPASGTNDGTITVIAEANTGAEARTATITITGGDVATTVNVTQAGSGALPPELLFPGSDFNDWSAFTGALNGNVVFGEKSTDGGIGGSGALLLKGTHGSKNGFSFTAKVPEGFSAAGKTEITFWIKGTSTGKALSMNVYTGTGTQPGTDYEAYNIESGTTSDVVLEPTGTNNYDGSINTGEEWIKVTLNISSIAGQINTTAGQNLFAIKLGKTGVYDLLVDDIMIK